MSTAVHFTIDAAWLTDLVRSLWADEGQAEKAFNLLDAAFPTMDRETMCAILCGRKKLTGDSDGEGMLLENDNVKVSRCGNSLDPKDVYARLNKKLHEAEATVRDMADLATGDVVLMGSPKGAVMVPRNRTVPGGLEGRVRRLKDGMELEEIPHRELGLQFGHREPDDRLFKTDNEERLRAWEAKLERHPDDDRARLVVEHLREIVLDERENGQEADLPRKPLFGGREEPDTPPEPPKPEPKITSDTGWLSPEGKFYPCPYEGHIALAHSLGFDEPRLEKMGWIKVQNGNFYWDFSGHFKASQRQIDAVFDWSQERGVKMPWLGEEQDDASFS